MINAPVSKLKTQNTLAQLLLELVSKDNGPTESNMRREPAGIGFAENSKILVPGVFILYVALNAEVKFDFYPLINTAAILISAGVIVSVLFMILQKMEDSSTKEEK